MPYEAVVTFALNILSGLVALLTSYYAYKSNRLIGSSVLTAISIGFMLLGIGLVADAGTSLASGRTIVQSLGGRVFVLFTIFADYTYLTVQMLAYLVMAIGYARAAYGRQPSAVPQVAVVGLALAGLYGYTLLSYFVAFVLLAFIVFQGALLRIGGKGKFSPMVLIAFGLILMAHGILLLSVLSYGTGYGAAVFLAGTAVQFLGFLSLLGFVVRSERIGAG